MKKIFFCLSVENVGVKDFSGTDADHLWNTPKKYYKKNGPRREELLWIEHVLELQQGIFQHFHANLKT